MPDETDQTTDDVPSGSMSTIFWTPTGAFRWEQQTCKLGWDANPLSTYGGLARLSGVHHACLPAENSAERDEHWRVRNLTVRGGHRVREGVQGVLGAFWVVLEVFGCCGGIYRGGC